MQVFATGKVMSFSMILQKLNCFTENYRRAVRIMKLTAIILLAACLQLSARGVSQTITLSLKDVSLLKVFKEIERQTDFTFFYDNDRIEQARKVTVIAKNLPLQQVLEMCFKDQPFTYNISGKTITIAIKKDKAEKVEKTSMESKPPGDIKGRLVDSKGEPISNATVAVKGTLKSTSTNANGEFSLNDVDENAVLVISHVQYETQTISLHGKELVNATLQIKVSSLDELQVIAYGTTTKRLNTGNVSSVKASDIQNQPVNNPILALQGRVPGLTIEQSTGVAGGAVTIRVQGRNNLNPGFTGSDPLIIVDGVPYPSENLPTFRSGLIPFSVLGGDAGGSSFNTPGSTLSFINPADIESIEVLKDADATAIYGSRAANGAILITMKKGKSGELKVDINAQNGWGKVGKKWDLLNSQQYLEMRHEAFKNDGRNPRPTKDYDLTLWDTTRYTDWQKELIGGTANYSRLNATVSGGANNVSYLIGGTYGKETSVFPGDFRNKMGSLHFNVNGNSVNKRFKIQLSGTFMANNNDLPAIDYTLLITLAPIAPSLYNSDGSLNWAPAPNGISSWTNPLSYNYSLLENKSTNLIANSILSYEVLPGLEIRSSLGYNQLATNQFIASKDQFFAPEQRGSLVRSSTITNSTIKSWIFEPQINYKKEIGPNKFNLLAGSTFQQQTNDGTWIDAEGQSSDQLLRNLAAATAYGLSTINSDYRYNGVFGRLSYILKNRYLVNLSGRRDGSSRFGSHNSFHNFGAVGLGWIFSEESFIKEKLPFLTFGKIRTSYGTTGNDQIGDYQFMSLYTTTTNTLLYQNIRGLQAGGISNPDLQWEETKKMELGLDLGFVNDRILFTANYFRNRTSNTLTNVNLPAMTGASLFRDNFPAVIENTGLEFSLRTDNVKTKNFTWSTNFNLTVPHNKLVSFPDLANSTSVNDVIIGQPLSILKAFQFSGIDPQTGVYQFIDSKGNTTITPDYLTDRIAILNSSPKFYGGIQNSFSFKGFQLDFLFQFTKQDGFNYLQVGQPGIFNNLVIPGNQPVEVMNRWQKPGDIAEFPRFTQRSSTYNSDDGNRSFKDASYLRLKNASFSYNISQSLLKKIHVKASRLFINAQNILTITKYKGLDPETQSIWALPPLRVVTIGIQLGF